MESFVKSDLFFFITGFSVILITLFWLIFIAMALYFAYKILKNLKIISSILKDQTEKISSDTDKVRDKIITDVEEIRKETKTSALIFFRLFKNISKNFLEPKGRNKTKKK